MTPHPIETAAREAFGPEPEPIEARPMTARQIAVALGASAIGIIGATVLLYLGALGFRVTP